MMTKAENLARFQSTIRPQLPGLYRALLELLGSPDRLVSACAILQLAAAVPDLSRQLQDGGFSEDDMTFLRELRDRLTGGEFGQGDPEALRRKLKRLL